MKVKFNLQEVFQCHFSGLNKLSEGLWHMKNKPKAEKQNRIHEMSAVSSHSVTFLRLDFISYNLF